MCLCYFSEFNSLNTGCTEASLFWSFPAVGVFCFRSAIATAMEKGGGTLSEIYQSAKKLLLRTRDGLERLERLEYSSGIDSPDLSMSIRNDLSQIQSLCADMDRLWRSVAAKSQRDLWKRYGFNPIGVFSLMLIEVRISN